MNVVLVLLDTLRRDHLGCYGNGWIRTPNIDRLAARGAVFDRSYIGSYPCMPARQDLWTGRFNFLRRGWSPLEYDEDDLVTALGRAGKTTMLVTDHYHLWSYGSGNYHMSFSGTEFIRGQESDNWVTDPDVPVRWPAPPEKLNHRWERYARNTARFEREEDYFAPRVFRRAAEWVENNHTTDGFFLMVDAFDPHEPFDPPKHYADLYDPDYAGDGLLWPRYGRPERHGYTAEEVRHAHALYCGEVSMADAWLGVLLDKVEEKGLMENTLIALTSDHGFLFGEHGWLGKHSPTLHQPIVNTPLIVYHPGGATAGQRLPDLVQLADLNPTVLEAMGVEPLAGSQGRSLLPSVTGRRILSRKTAAFGAFGGPVYATDGEWIYVKRPRADNAPLYWYTNSHFNQWGFGGHNDVEGSRRHLQEYGEGRFPVSFDGMSSDHAGPRLSRADPDRRPPEGSGDELYRVSAGTEQAENLAQDRPEQAGRMRHNLAHLLRDLKAPEEQFERLRLKRGA